MNLRNIAFLLLPLLLAACSSVGTKPEAPAPSAESKAPAKAEPGKSTRGGGYYLDDGPGDNPPANLDEIPDAVPKYEVLQAKLNRPYVALGETYTPMTEYQPYKARGIASWYGKRYHANKTSSGEVYDMYGMTAAHPTLPIPSYVRVTNPANGKSVIVRVNDRGPFKKDRLIDLSYAAAYRLGLVASGSGLVEVEAIDTRPPEQVSLQKVPEVPQNKPVSAGGPYVQAGAFRSKDNADQLSDRLRQQGLVQDVTVESWYNEGIYRVRLGPYASRDEAERAAAKIRQSLGISTLVTTR